MIRRSSAAEIARLIADVLGDDRVAAEAAVARLAIAGARAVDRVVAALDGATPPQQAMLLLALERIGDPRALAVAEVRVGSADAALAVAAIGTLRPLLQSERSDVAERAIAAVTATALDHARPDAVRAAALDALHELGTEAAEAVNRALEHDPSPIVRRLAGWTRAAAPPEVGASRAAAECALDAPASPASGEDEAALEAWATTALPDDPDAVRAAVASAAGTVPLTDLHRLVVAVRDREAATADRALRDRWTSLRGALHHALAARGSRVALYDLRETLEVSRGHLPVSMLAALSTIGDASCLEPLAAAMSMAGDAWDREQLARTFAEVRHRERLTRRHAVMKRIEGKYPGVKGL